MRNLLVSLVFLLSTNQVFAHGGSVIDSIGQAVSATGIIIKAQAPNIEKDLLGIKAKTVGAKVEVKVYTNAEPKKPYTYICEMVHPQGGGDEYFDCVEQILP